MTRRWWLVALWVVAVSTSVVLFACNLYFGEPNQDEGWYLYAGKLVSQGKLPYVDFASTQGPVMAFAYAPAQPLVAGYGLAGGRLYTAGLAVAGLICAAWLAFRLAPSGMRHWAALAAFALIGVNVYQSYFTTIVKTYSLGGLLLILGLLALSVSRGRMSVVCCVLSAILISLAAGTRTSAGVVLPVVFCCLACDSWAAKRRGDVSVSPRWLWFGFGGAVACCAVFLPFLVRAPVAFKFGLLDYHAGRRIGGIVELMAYKAGFVSRVTQAYFVPIALTLAVGLYRLMCGKSASEKSGPRLIPSLPCLWISVFAVTLVHLLAPFPYDDYQAVVFPVFAVAVTVSICNVIAEHESMVRVWALVALVFVCVASAFSSPINQNWFIGERDRIWWPMRKESPLVTLRRAGSLVRSISGQGNVLLTQDTYLAVESGMSVPAGMEMGPFSYYPDWSRERAEQCHVLNREMMLELLASCDADVAAVSGYGFAVKAPEITSLAAAEQDRLWQAMIQRYEVSDAIEPFGQAGTKLKILRLKR